MWGEVAEGLVGAHGVVDTLPSQQIPIQGSHLQGEVVDLIELLGMGALSPLHTTVELGGAGWEHEEPDTLLPAGFLETRLELRAPIHLDGVYWERPPVQYSIQESRGRVRGSPGVGLHHVPAGDHVSGGEVLQHHAGEWPHVQSVHPDQVPGFLYTIPFGLAYRVGTTPQPFAGGDGAAQGLPEHPTGFQGAQYPSYHRGGHLPASIPYPYHQLVFPPAGVLLPQVQDCQGQLPRPGGLTEPSGPVAPLFQAPQVPGLVPSLPPVECLAADTEVATGQCRIAVSCVVVHPLQPLLGQPADLPHPAYVLGTRSSRSYYFHDDTILSVILHYEREQTTPCLRS